MTYLGDIVEDDADLTFYWNTCASDGASITRSTNGTVKLIRDDGTDCTAGSITDTKDSPDTGIHKCVVDLSANANCIVGHDYMVWIDGAVIDTQTVNAALAHLSIENRDKKADVVKLGGVIQSATDLKDFADSGYNPATHKVQTIQTGDSYAVVAHTDYGNAKLVRASVPATAFNTAAANTLSGHDPGANLGTSTLVAADVQAACDASLVSINLDHLLKVACDDNDIKNIVTDVSVIALMLADGGDISDYNYSTDSQEAIADSIAAAADILYNPVGSAGVVGTENNTFAACAADDGVKWSITDAGSAIEAIAIMAIGSGKQTISLIINGHFSSDTGRVVYIYAYNYVTNGYDLLGSGSADTEMQNGSVDRSYEFPLTFEHTKPTAVVGEVYIKFVAQTQNVGDVLHLDLIGVAGVSSGAASPAIITHVVYNELHESLIVSSVAGSVGSLVGHTVQTGDNYPIVTHADYGNVKLARTGADSDTLKTLSDQIDNVSGGGGEEVLTKILLLDNTLDDIRAQLTELTRVVVRLNIP